MNVPVIAHVLGSFLMLLAGLLVAPSAFALVDGMLLATRPSPEAQAFLAHAWMPQSMAFWLSATITFAAGLYLRLRFRTDVERVGSRESCAIVTGTWVAFALFGALPYWFSGVSFTDAFFETMSGFTTTGASVFPVVEAIPRPLMLWRCLTQWIGGMGIVVLAVAILPILSGGASLFRAEAPGGATFEKPVPRIRTVASFLWRIYLAGTVLQIGLLRLCGMSWFDAVCHTATTVSTGGFSTRTASIAAYGPAVQWVITVFMFLSGVSFLVHHLWMTRKFQEAQSTLEFRAYATLVAAAIVFVSLGLFATGTGPEGLEPKIRAAAFQVVSIVTTTGFATENYDVWVPGLRSLMFVFLFVGGCTGSTSGSMKILRHMIFWRATLSELRRVGRPRAVWPVKLGGRTMDRDMVSNVLGFGVLYFGAFFFVTVALTEMNLDLTAALGASAACLGNVGPGLGSVGPAGNYAAVAALGKWLLSLAMVVGRLEVYSVLVLLMPRTWTE